MLITLIHNAIGITSNWAFFELHVWPTWPPSAPVPSAHDEEVTDLKLM